MPELSLYASYSRSYLPSAGDQFTSLDLEDAALRPERAAEVAARLGVPLPMPLDALHPEVEYQGPLFPRLAGFEVHAMWQMLFRWPGYAERKSQRMRT